MPLIGRFLFAGLVLLPGLAVSATVRVSPLSQLQEPLFYSAPATVVSEDHATLSAQLNAQITEIPVRVGDEVKPGQVLARLDCRDYQLAQQLAERQLATLEPRIALAHAQLKRTQTLLDKRSASEEQRDLRQTELDSLRAEHAAAQVALKSAGLAVSRCEVRAPFAGVVTARAVAEGSLASPGTALLQLLRHDGLEVQADVPQSQSAELSTSPVLRYENAGQRYALRLRTLLPLVDGRTHARKARLTFIGAQALPGSTGRLWWQARGARVPVGLVVTRQGQLGLMLYEDAQARFYPLPEAVEGQAAVVNLPAETQVIIEGQHAVEDGDPVEVRE